MRGSLTAEESQDWPVITVNLKENQTLGGLFDDGFRPYRFPALETTTLEQKYLRLRPHFSSTLEAIDFPAEYVTLIIDKPWVVSRLEAVTPWLSEEEAYTNVRLWVKALSFLDSGDSVETYFEKLKTFETLSELRMEYDQDFTLNIASGDKYKALLVVRARPRKRLVDQKPVRVKMIVTWSPYKYAVDRKTYKELIPSPPGYEDFSMIAGEDFGPGGGIKQPVFNTSKFEYAIKPENISKLAVEKALPELKKKSNRLPWLITGVLLLGIISLLRKTLNR